MWQSFPIQCTGGLVKNIPEIQLGLSQPGSAITLINFEPSVKGGYAIIKGYTKFDSNVVPSSSSSTQLLGVAFFDGFVVVPREGKIYKSSGSGWSEIATGRTQTTRHRFTVINLNGTRKLIGTDGSNYPYSWDKTTFTNLSGSADVLGATHARQFKDHVFYAIGSHLVFTEPFDENGFDPASGAGDLYLPDTITGLMVFRENLIIFTKSSIHSLTGTSSTNFALSSISETIGCPYEGTIQEVAGDIAFLSYDGVRLVGSTQNIGDFSNQIASKAIQSDVTSFTGTYSQFSSLTIKSKSQYRLFGYSSSLPKGNSVGWLGTQFQPQDPLSFQWSKLEGFKVYACDSQTYAGDEYTVFVSDTQYVYSMESSTKFEDDFIKAHYHTPYLSFDDPTLRKTLYKVNVYFGEVNGVLVGNLSLVYDQGVTDASKPPKVTLEGVGGSSLWGSFLWGTGKWSSPMNVKVEKQVLGSGFNVSLQFSFNTEGTDVSSTQASFVIDTIVIEFYTNGRK